QTAKCCGKNSSTFRLSPRSKRSRRRISHRSRSSPEGDVAIINPPTSLSRVRNVHRTRPDQLQDRERTPYQSHGERLAETELSPAKTGPCNGRASRRRDRRRLLRAAIQDGPRGWPRESRHHGAIIRRARGRRSEKRALRQRLAPRLQRRSAKRRLQSDESECGGALLLRRELRRMIDYF